METHPSISICLPTRGEPTLKRTVDSILPQLGTDHEICFCWDTPQQKYKPKDFESPQFKHTKRRTIVERKQPVGQEQRNHLLDKQIASGTHLMWMGSDDRMAPGALDAVRMCAESHPGRVILAQLRGWWPGRPIVWSPEMTHEERFREGWLGDHNIVSPNQPDRLGRFGLRYTGDWDFLKTTVENFGGLGNVVWLPYVVAILRPEK